MLNRKNKYKLFPMFIEHISENQAGNEFLEWFIQ